MDSQQIVFDVKRFAIHDGPGIRTTVYLKGCPLCCPWCHNPEGQSADPEIIFWENRCIQCDNCLQVCSQGAVLHSADCEVCGRCVLVCPTGAREMIGRQVTISQVMAEIERDIVFYDESGGGVTFSGGEPLCQPEFLTALLQACKERDIHTAVDTTGFGPTVLLTAISPNVDLFLYDLKLMDEAAHRQLTGVSNRLILENLRALDERNANVIVRIPIIPGITDQDRNITQIGRFVSSLACVQRVDVLPYNPASREKHRRLGRVYPLNDSRPLPEGRMEQIAANLNSLGLTVRIGG